MFNMQSGGVHKGVPSQSLLFHSLKVYLSNKDRLQPLIGLSCVTECVKVGSNGEALYLCEVCVCRLSKADIRSHIMGSLHRYNYIKAWHPHLVSEWEESPDLSKLAWPLMEIAQILEKREGTGDVQVLELDADTYKAVTSHNKVMTLLRAIRTGGEQSVTQTQAEKLLTQPLECPTAQSQRVVLPPRNLNAQQKKATVKSLVTIKSQKASFQVPKPLTSTKRPAAASHSSSVQSPPKYQKLNDKKNSGELGKQKGVVHCYKGSKPLIGLGCVVECRNRVDGSLTCYLCHCCRSKASKDEITDHLASSSHHFNYMMEFHPHRVEVMRGGLSGDRQILSSAAKKVELEEGRGQLKVIRVAASLCSRLSVNSYHWCIKTLSDLAGWPGTKIPNREKPLHCVSQKQTASVPPLQRDHATNTGRFKQKDVMEKRKRKKACGSHPIFKVSLPLIEGKLLMERTSFSSDALAESPPHPHPEDSALALLPQTTRSLIYSDSLEPDHDRLEHTPSADGIHRVRLGHAPPQHSCCMGNVERQAVLQHSGGYGSFTDSGTLDGEGYFTVVEDRIGPDSYQRVLSTSQQPRTTVLGDRVSVYVSTARRSTDETGERATAVLLSTREAIREGVCHTEGRYEELEEQTCPVHQCEHGTYYMHEEGFGDEEWLYKAELQRRVGLTVEVSRGEQQGQEETISSETHPPYYPAQSFHQYNPNDFPGPHRYDTQSNMAPHGEHMGGWSHGATQHYPDFPQTAPKAYVTLPNIYPSFPGCSPVTFNPHHNDRFKTSPDLSTLHHDISGEELQYQPSRFTVPEQAQGFVSHPDLYPDGTIYGQPDALSGFGYGPSFPASQPISQSFPPQDHYWGHIPTPNPGHNATQLIQRFF